MGTRRMAATVPQCCMHDTRQIFRKRIRVAIEGLSLPGSTPHGARAVRLRAQACMDGVWSGRLATCGNGVGAAGSAITDA